MRDVKINSIYKHFKGNYYLVVDIGIDSENNQKVVIYRALYGDCTLYVRPIDMFLSEVDKEKYPNVEQKYRFEEQVLESFVK